MKTEELKATQRKICEALGLDPDRLFSLKIDMGISYCRFTAEGYVADSDGKKFAIRDGNGARPAMFALTSITDEKLPEQRPVVYVSVIGHDTESFESMPDALQALSRTGDQIRDSVGIKPKDAVRIGQTGDR